MRVADLRPGLVLGEAVRDVNGRLLMGEGLILNDRYIGVLKAWGIGEVAVRGEDPLPNETGQEGPGRSDVEAEAREIVARRFAVCGLDHPFLQDVQALAVARTASLLEKGLYRREQPVPVAPVEAVLPPLDIPALTASNPALGAMPEVLACLAQAMENPSASPVEVAQIIMSDPGLTAKLLKVVNSAMYGFPQRIETITRAVTVIGVQQLSALALGLTVMNLFKDVDRELLDHKDFWRHSLACACAARSLASLLGLANTERFFVAGLLHDVGLLLLLLHLPGRMRPVLETVRSGRESLASAEQRLLGTDHSAAGAALLGGWKLPQSLVQAAKSHHDPRECEDEAQAAIVHTADFLAEALVFGSIGQGILMPFCREAFDRLNAPAGVAGLMFERVDAQLSQLETIFLPNVA